MARKFTVELIARYVKGSAVVQSSVEHADLLGSADELIIQANTTGVSGESPTLTVR